MKKIAGEWMNGMGLSNLEELWQFAQDNGKALNGANVQMHGVSLTCFNDWTGSSDSLFERALAEFKAIPPQYVEKGVKDRAAPLLLVVDRLHVWRDWMVTSSASRQMEDD
jgi:hypothetical protein